MARRELKAAASTDDVWYRAYGVTAVRPLTAAARNAGNYEGSQIEVVLTWKPKNISKSKAVMRTSSPAIISTTSARMTTPISAACRRRSNSSRLWKNASGAWRNADNPVRASDRRAGLLALLRRAAVFQQAARRFLVGYTRRPACCAVFEPRHMPYPRWAKGNTVGPGAAADASLAGRCSAVKRRTGEFGRWRSGLAQSTAHQASRARMKTIHGVHENDEPDLFGRWRRLA